jgi:hypothetical protein
MKQRSRVQWLREGDRNTSFFHARATARKRAIKIKALRRDDGSRCEGQNEIKSLVQEFYGELFSSEPTLSIDDVLDSIPCKVSVDMNADLLKEYTNEEIKFALFQMGPTKAPGPDGFPALFYQTHWEFLEKDICHAIRSFLQGGSLPEGFCDNTIVMIPKVTNPEHLKNFRPISLCNVLHKIASEVLTNRLKLILPLIVSDQSAFVPGRFLTDNALIAYECLHTIRQQQSKRPFFALKVDMMKAYDRVEWNFLFGCLQKLGFDQNWIEMVMRCCVTSVRYAVRVSDELTELVIPTRGIRQGDPISPYLFLLCTEGLSCLLQRRADQGELQGLCNGRLGPPISHLLFADNSIFFARSDERSVNALQSTLQTYCEGSGQKINLDKSSVFLWFSLSCGYQEQGEAKVKCTL